MQIILFRIATWSHVQFRSHHCCFEWHRWFDIPEWQTQKDMEMGCKVIMKSHHNLYTVMSRYLGKSLKIKLWNFVQTCFLQETILNCGVRRGSPRRKLHHGQAAGGRCGFHCTASPLQVTASQVCPCPGRSPSPPRCTRSTTRAAPTPTPTSAWRAPPARHTPPTAAPTRWAAVRSCSPSRDRPAAGTPTSSWTHWASSWATGSPWWTTLHPGRMTMRRWGSRDRNLWV